MAAAANCPLLHRTAALTSLSATVQKPNHHHPLHLPASQLHLPQTQPLRIKTPPLSFLLPSHHHLPPRHRLRAAAAYTETDDEDDGEEAEDGEDEQQPVRSRPSAPEDERRLYVGNLPFSMTPAQLTDVFSQAGTVDAVDVVYDRGTDRSRGFAFVTMGSADDANEAIRMFDGAQLGGRTAKVNFPEVPRGGEREVLGPRTRRGPRRFVESPYKVYAGNLGWTVTSQSLRDAFAAQLGLLGARVIYDRDSGLSRGFGFVSFASPEDAQSAIDAMNGRELDERPLRLSLAAGRPSVAPSQTSAEDQAQEQLSAVES